MSSKLVTVLYVSDKSYYLKDSRFDCWTKSRNALSYSGLSPVIAHPPCRLWGRLRKMSTADIQEKELAISSVDYIRKYGGVLEHPAGSTLWDRCSLVIPGHGYDAFGGFSVSINQSWFGYPAVKNTWLYIVGCTVSELPPLPMNFDAITHTVCSSKKKTGKRELSKMRRDLTYPMLIDWLYEVICVIDDNKKRQT